MHFRIEAGEFYKSANKLNKGPLESDKIALAQAVEDGLQSSGNYVEVFRRAQGFWKPLNTKYKKRKIKKGLSGQIWHLRGDSFEALTTRIQITGKTQLNSHGKELKIMSVGKRLRVTLRYRILKPAATGWPERRQRRSWFTKNDNIRPWLEIITPKGEQAVLDKMMDAVLAWIIRATS